MGSWCKPTSDTSERPGQNDDEGCQEVSSLTRSLRACTPVGAVRGPARVWCRGTGRATEGVDEGGDPDRVTGWWDAEGGELVGWSA